MRTSSVSFRLFDGLGARRKLRSLFPFVAIAGIVFVSFLQSGTFGGHHGSYGKTQNVRKPENHTDVPNKSILRNDETLKREIEKEPKVSKVQNDDRSSMSPIPSGNTKSVMTLRNQSEILEDHPQKWNSWKLPKDPLNYFKFEEAPFKDYSLNVHLSQTLPINRPLPEKRQKECLTRKYNLTRNRKVSVIIPFYNEMWSVLLRTINSILNRTPPEMIHEIILVDDNSSFENLLSPLEHYIKSVPIITLLRLKAREGLIRARMAGAYQATGNTLAFVDAHVEVTKGWIEPLISLIEKEPTTIAVPVINAIDPLTLEYSYVPVRSVGTFSWDLDFIWKDEMDGYDRTGVDAHPTPAMIGCAFVVDRQFFFDVGSFDEGMNIWGGEQIEISFRTWMCGGALKIVPCSHVGHIYRAHLPYAFDEFVLYRNLQRIAEVWMDDYKRYYYYTIRQDPFKFSSAEIEGVNKRKELRRRLQCKPFSWYLETLVPHIRPPPMGSVYYGNMRNIGSQQCLEKKDRNVFDFEEVSFNYCSLQFESFTFTFTDTGNIVHKGLCLTFRNKMDSAVVLAPCDQTDSKQVWSFQPGLPDIYQNLVVGVDVKHAIGSFKLKHENFTLCLSQILHNNMDIAGALPCVAMNSHQFWVFTYTLNFKRSFNDLYVEGSFT